jgi:hypothetical protein
MIELTKERLLIVFVGFNLLFSFVVGLIIGLAFNKQRQQSPNSTSILRNGAEMVVARKTEDPQWWAYELMPPIPCEDDADCSKQMCVLYNIMLKETPYYDPWICFQPNSNSVCT